MMYKKDFRLIAKALSTVEESSEKEKILLALLPVLKSSNPRFLVDEFLKASRFKESA